MSLDMTIDSALSDPMIRAVMRADRVEPQAFERLLRSKAKTLDTGSRPGMPAPKMVRPWTASFQGFCCA